MPGPLVAVTPSAPPNAAPMVDVIAAISSSAWNVLTPKFLCLASSCRMSLAGVIGYAPKNSSLAAELGGGHQSQGQRLVAGDLAILAGRQLRLGDLVLRAERFDGFAVVVAGLERRRLASATSGFLPNFVVDEPQRRLQRRSYSQYTRPRAKKFRQRSASFCAQPQPLDGRAGELGHVDRVDTGSR